MKVLLSKVTSKGQATIPADVRRLLKLSPGDRIAFRVEGSRVELARATPIDRDFAEALEPTLSAEWLTKEDDEAYGDL